MTKSDVGLSASRIQGTGGMGIAGCEIHLAPPQALPVPLRLWIPGLNIESNVVELGIEPDGALQAPENGHDVGWYPQGARPGYCSNMVISGHLDWDRAPGVFWHLAELDPGDEVNVMAEDGVEHTYKVDWMRQYASKDVPLNQILGPTTDSLLTLITCGGGFAAPLVNISSVSSSGRTW